MVTVQVLFDNDAIDSLEEDAPALVTVSSIPKIFWLGSLAPGDPFDPGTDYFPSDLDGAIFEAVQFEDIPNGKYVLTFSQANRQLDKYAFEVLD